MTGFWLTLKRELACAWFSPRPWLLLVTLLILQGTALSSILTAFTDATDFPPATGPLEILYGQSLLVPLSYLLICPLLTVHTFAGQRRSGMLENLSSFPVSVSTVVLGKYAASFTTLVLLWLPSVAYPLMLGKVIETDPLAICTAYLGIWGIGAGFLAVGICFSALVRTQFLALVLTAGVLSILLLPGFALQYFNDGWLHQICEQTAIQAQLVENSQGIISLHSVVYDATLLILPLFVAMRTVGAWRWS